MSDFEDVKPYTQAELDQQAIWANEFDQWWENEGQYQRAGGGQYERTFAWWAWLNREQKQQAIIDEHTEVIKLQDADLRKYEKQIESLKTQLNNMEACYIGIKKINDEQSAIIQGHFAARQDMQKRIAACAALAAGWSAITWDKTTHWTEGYEEGCYHCSGQIEEALRGGHD